MIETVGHFLIECPRYAAARETFIDQFHTIIEELNEAYIEAMSNQTNKKKKKKMQNGKMAYFPDTSDELYLKQFIFPDPSIIFFMFIWRNALVRYALLVHGIKKF